MDVSTSEPFTSHGEVSFLIHPFSNGIEGQTLLSMLSDGLIYKQLIVGVVIAREGGGTTGECEIER